MVYVQKYEGVDTEAERQETRGRKHTGPLDGQITITEKKYRKVTMNVEECTCEGYESCMRNEESLKSMSSGKRHGRKQMRSRPTRLLRSRSLDCGGEKARRYVDELLTLRHQHPFG